MSLSNRKRIDSTKLKFSYFDPSKDDFLKLNFKQKDGSDPLDIYKFIHNNPLDHVTNHVSKIYSIRYADQLTAFFTLSMSQIESQYLNDEDDINKVKFNVYPALLLGQLGIDKDFRGQGLGYYIILYCLGLGQILSEKVGCAFLILRTTRTLAEKYYEPKYNFKWKRNYKQKVWMYRKLF